MELRSPELACFKPTNHLHRCIHAGPKLTLALSTHSGATATGEAFTKEREAVRHHAQGSTALWRRISLFIAIPAVIVGYFNAQNLLAEHEAHVEHIKEENGGEVPERIAYDYMNKRAKSFPWGNKSLFYNEHTNLPPPE